MVRIKCVLTTISMVLLFSEPSFAVDKALINKSLIEKLQSLEASSLSQKSMAKDKDKILYFWATWCPDCKEKLTTTFKQSELYKKFDIYLIATDKDREKITHFQKKYELMPYVYIDEGKEVQKKLKVYSVPTFVRLKDVGQDFEIVTIQSGGKIEEHLQ